MVAALKCSIRLGLQASACQTRMPVVRVVSVCRVRGKGVGDGSYRGQVCGWGAGRSRCDFVVGRPTEAGPITLGTLAGAAISPGFNDQDNLAGALSPLIDLQLTSTASGTTSNKTLPPTSMFPRMDSFVSPRILGDGRGDTLRWRYYDWRSWSRRSWCSVTLKTDPV